MMNIETMLDYKTAAESGVLISDLDPGQEVELTAIDVAVCALNMDPVFAKNFKAIGISLDDIASGADSLETFFAGVIINTSQAMVNNGNIQKWGQRILTMSENGQGKNGNGEVNKRLKNFVLAEKDIFKIEI